MEWEADEYESGDEGPILQLFEETFGTRRSTAHWKWEFQDGPAGPGLIHLAWAGDRLVGQYAIVPVRMTFGGKSILGAQSVDTMTASDFRRQGIFEDLARRTFSEARDIGVDLVYGFPNQNSYQGFVKKLGFVSVASVREYRYRLDWRKFVGDRHPRSIVGSFMDEYLRFVKALDEPRGVPETVSGFADEHDTVWKEVARTAGIAVSKTTDYLNWRYRAVPDSSYEVLQIRDSGAIGGYAVCTKADSLATLVDLVAPSDRVAVQLFQSVAKDAKKAGCLSMRAWEVARTGTRSPRIPSSPRHHEPTVLIAFSPTGTFSKEDLSSEAGWSMQMGDSDGV